MLRTQLQTESYVSTPSTSLPIKVLSSVPRVEVESRRNNLAEEVSMMQIDNKRRRISQRNLVAPMMGIDRMDDFRFEGHQRDCRKLRLDSKVSRKKLRLCGVGVEYK